MSLYLEDIKNKIRPILQKYGIKKAGIFGSVARGESMAHDIDILEDEVPVIRASAKQWYTFKIYSKALATLKNFSTV